MRKFLLSLTLLFCLKSYSQQSFVKIPKMDSASIMEVIVGEWEIQGKYTAPYSFDEYIDKPSFVIGNIAYIFEDTFKKYGCEIEVVNDKLFLKESYFIESNEYDVAYRFTIYANSTPFFGYTSNYIETEFILYNNKVYYDLDGIVYKFKKSKI